MTFDERIITANDNTPLIETAQATTQLTTRKSRRQKSISRKTPSRSLQSSYNLQPGQMQWHPQNKSLPSSSKNTKIIFSRKAVSSVPENKNSAFPQRSLMSVFIILMMASIVSLFYGFRPEISGGLTGATALISLIGLILPKSHRRKREFFSLSAWVTGIIAVNIFYPMTIIEFLTFASVSGFVLSMLVRLVSPAVAATLTLASLIAVIWPQLGFL